MKNQDTIIKLDNVHEEYQMGESIVKALDGVDVTINKGDFVVIIGPSGSGKSTMMNMVGALSFSFIIGSASGILPAMQASKMKPAEALRYE